MKGCGDSRTYALDAGDSIGGIVRVVLGQHKTTLRAEWIRIEAHDRRLLLAERKERAGASGGKQEGTIAANRHNDVRPAHDILAQRASKFKSARLVKSTHKARGRMGDTKCVNVEINCSG